MVSIALATTCITRLVRELVIVESPITRAKLKQSQLFERGGILRNLEHRAIYLRNDIRDIHRYIDRWGRHLTSVRLAQAHPNKQNLNSEI